MKLRNSIPSEWTQYCETESIKEGKQIVNANNADVKWQYRLIEIIHE